MFSQHDTSKCISPYPLLMTCYNIKITTLGCGFFTINVNINILTLFTTMRLHVSRLSKKLSMSCHKKVKEELLFSKFATTYYYLLNMNIYDQVKKEVVPSKELSINVNIPLHTIQMDNICTLYITIYEIHSWISFWIFMSCCQFKTLTFRPWLILNQLFFKISA